MVGTGKNIPQILFAECLKHCNLNFEVVRTWAYLQRRKMLGKVLTE